MGSLTHRLTMLADVHRDEDAGYYAGKSPHGSDTLQEEPVIADLPCFITPEAAGNMQRQRQAWTDLDARVIYFVMLVEPGIDIKVEDNVSNVRDSAGLVYLEGPADVVAVSPHRGFGPHTTNLTEIHLRYIGT